MYNNFLYSDQPKSHAQRPGPEYEEGSDEEQQSAYQKLLSTMIQGVDDNSEGEESEVDEEEDEVLEVDERKSTVSFLSKMNILLLFTRPCLLFQA